MKFGFDFDGTITKNPATFKVLINCLAANEKNKLYLISGTAKSKYEDVCSELLTYDINPLIFTKIILKDQETDIDQTTKWKFQKIDELKIRCFFENREETCKTLSELCTILKVI